MDDKNIRLIDANEIANGMDQYFCNVCSSSDGERCRDCEINEVLRLIDNTPTVEAQPVKHGYWEEKPSYAEDKALGFDFQIVCSECDLQNSYFIFGEGDEPEEKTFIRSKYCPNCGARMDGDKR